MTKLTLHPFDGDIVLQANPDGVIHIEFKPSAQTPASPSPVASGLEWPDDEPPSLLALAFMTEAKESGK